MPQEYFQQLSVLKRKAGFHAAMSWLLVALPCVVLALLQICLPASILLFVLFLILLVTFCLANRKNKKQNLYPWAISFSGLDAVIQSTSLTKLSSDVFYQQTQQQNIKIRLLIQIEESFSPDAAAKQRKTANRKINKRFGSRQKASMQEASHLLRIHLVICPKNSPELITWIQKTNQTLHRAESTLNAAFIPEANQLLIPNLSGIFLFSELKRYTVGVHYLCSLLQAEGVATPLE